MLPQIKNPNNDKKILQEELDHKGSLLEKVMMNDPKEKLSNAQIETSEKGTNTESVDTQIQKIAYIDKSQSQRIRMSYYHPNHNNRCGQRQDQKIYKQYFSSRKTNYKCEKEKR